MCGVYGFFNLQQGSEALEKMDKLLKHRGPDGQGIWSHSVDRIYLGHRRLAILDLSPSGQQPMQSHDGRFILSFNGEIYNYQTLRTELESLGHVFHTSCDTEVLLNAMAQWHVSGLQKLQGMFAFALWNIEKKELLLARDPTGIKPLFIATDNNGVAFASEMTALTDLKSVWHTPDPHALEMFIDFGYLPNPHYTGFKNIQALPAGYYATCSLKKPLSLKPWHCPPAFIPKKSPNTSLEEANTLADTLYTHLTNTMKTHLHADVPVGVLLSGGLDSGILTSIACRVSHSPVHTITLGFENTEDERLYAKTVSEFLDTQHHEVVLSLKNFQQTLPQRALLYRGFMGDSGLLSNTDMYTYCQKFGLKVLIVGEGSDELFAGYTPSRKITLPWVQFLPRLLQYYWLWRQHTSERYGPSLSWFFKTIRSLDTHPKMDLLDLEKRFVTQYSLASNLNLKVDHTSMAAGIEARVPFQDISVVNFALQLPNDILLRDEQNKWILRHMARRHNLLPENIITRKKMSLGLPKNWDMSCFVSDKTYGYSDEFSDWIHSSGFFKKSAPQHNKQKKKTLFWHRHISDQTLFGRLCGLFLWEKTFLNSKTTEQKKNAA